MGLWVRDSYTNKMSADAASGTDTSAGTGTSFGQFVGLTLASDTAHVLEGSRALKATPSSSTTPGYAAIQGDVNSMRLGMVAGHTYMLHTNVYIPSGSFAQPVRTVVWDRVAGTYIARLVSNYDMGLRDQWQLQTVVFTIDPAATEAFIRLDVNNKTTETSQSVWWDKLMLAETSNTAVPWIAGGASGSHGPVVVL